MALCIRKSVGKGACRGLPLHPDPSSHSLTSARDTSLWGLAGGGGGGPGLWESEISAETGSFRGCPREAFDVTSWERLACGTTCCPQPHPALCSGVCLATRAIRGCPSPKEPGIVCRAARQLKESGVWSPSSHSCHSVTHQEGTLPRLFKSTHFFSLNRKFYIISINGKASITSMEVTQIVTTKTSKMKTIHSLLLPAVCPR